MKIVTLEIGSSAVKAGVCAFDPAAGTDAPMTVLAVEEEPLVNCVRYGRIQNVEDVKAQTALVLRRLAARPEMAGDTIRGVYVGIGGRSMSTVQTSAELPLPGEQLISDSLIERLHNEAVASIDRTKREVFEILPLRYTVNGVATSRPVGTYGSSIGGDFTVIVCDPLNARNIDRVVIERLNLQVCEYEVRPLALAEAVLTQEEMTRGCMLADVGAETTTVVIYTQGALRYINTIPLGSRNITRDLAVGLGLTEERAEEVKLRVGNAVSEGSPTSADQIEIDSYVQARAGEIVANIDAYIGFAGLTPEDLRAGIVVTGRGARLRNFCRLLSEYRQMDVRMASVPAGVRIADSSLNAAGCLDLIAVALAGRRDAVLDPDIPVSVEEPEPVTEEKEEEKPRQQEEPVTDVRSDYRDEEEETESPDERHYGREDGQFGYGDDDEEEDRPRHSGRRHNVDDDLLDSDEEERRRRRSKEAMKDADRANKDRSLSGKLGSLRDRLMTLTGNILSKTDDGRDIE